MELKSITIKSYKSIQSPVTIHFYQDLPTILIGKNGSGKTTILEAIEAIAAVNGNRYYRPSTPLIEYKVTIGLSAEDVTSLLPGLAYDPEKCEITAYSSDKTLKIDRVESDYVVPSLKKEITDVYDLAKQLKKALTEYQKQFAKLAHNDNYETPIGSYTILDADSHLTSYASLKFCTEHFIKTVTETVDRILTSFSSDDTTLLFHPGNYSPVFSYLYDTLLPFQLHYVKPDLPSFEKKYITVNETALKREITKINKKTKEARQQIETLIEKITEREKRIEQAIDTSNQAKEHEDEQYYRFLEHIQHIICQKCTYLKGENSSVLFRKDDPWYERTNTADMIFRTYVNNVYQGDDKELLLKPHTNENIPLLNEDAVREFEKYLNSNLPTFEENMYDSITVHSSKKNIQIYLNENTGDQVHLDDTSAGRRWYFSYYFMKNSLAKGDLFIIDEPAAALHPGAQREILEDIRSLTKRGVKVLYATHSPYLIPKEWQCVHFVSMTKNGTAVNGVSSNQELVSQMTPLVGNDIFDIQTVLDKYVLASPEVIARNVSELIRDTQKKRGIKNLQMVCDEIGIEYETMKSWNSCPTDSNGKKNKKFNSPSIQNVIKVLKWANET